MMHYELLGKQELEAHERHLDVLRRVASAAHVVVGLVLFLLGVLCRINGTGLGDAFR
jgi:hypothetical protein